MTTEPPIECLEGLCLSPDTTSRTEDEQDSGKMGEDKHKKCQSTFSKDVSRKSLPSSLVIKKIYTQQDLDTLVASADAVIVEFMTSWCGACKGIEPLWEELAIKHEESVVCAQVVCDKNKETKKLAVAHGVKSYPVFLVYERGKSDRWNGADRGKLERAFERLVGGGDKKRGKKKKGQK